MVLIESSNFPTHARLSECEVWFSSCFQLFFWSHRSSFVLTYLAACSDFVTACCLSPSSSFLRLIFLWNYFSQELTNTSWSTTISMLTSWLFMISSWLMHPERLICTMKRVFFCLAINVRLIHETLQDHFQIQLLNENQNNLLTSRMAGRKMEYGKIEHDQG